MPAIPALPAPARLRPAAVVNEEIRRLAARIALTGAERAQLAELWAEWQAAVDAEQAAA
ncbi:hypothetical protein [Streptomyces sp. CA-111067]|uniref:hypothetical protein n=1 Tax=Streptomyces sp. CA-111067 TaxID=3240046 RepID=UPI003D988949